MIYKLTKDIGPNKKPIFSLVGLFESFDVPKKIYGTIVRDATYVWNSFAKPDGRAGILITGMAGSGKSLMSKTLCNIASGVGTPVIMVSEMKIDLDVVNYLSEMNNCVIFIDEFAKVTDYSVQSHLLTLLSDSNKKRLFVLTDNAAYTVNQYILNRPERIRYHFEFDHLDSVIVEEYCKDMGVPDDFKNELLRLNMVNRKFCFDHLTTIVREAKESDRWELDWLISILNIKTLKSVEFLVPIKVSGGKDTELADVSLALSSTVVKTGLTVIEIWDNELEKYKFYKKSQSSAPITQPVNRQSDAISDLGDGNSPYELPVSPVPSGHTHMSKSTIYDDPKIVADLEAKTKLEKAIKEAYESVDMHFDNDDDYRYRRGNRNSSTGNDRPVIKVNLVPDYIIGAGIDNLIVYTDVTGKFNVTLKQTSKKY